MSDDLVTWLRAEIEADRRDANVKIIRQRWQIDPGHWATGTGIIGEDGRPVAVAIGDYAARHIVRHGPLDKIADCDAKLAILDEHYILWRHDTSEAYEEFSVVAIGGANKDHGCVTCHYYGQGGVKGYGYCRTVRLLGKGYRRRDGYRPEWAPWPRSNGDGPPCSYCAGRPGPAAASSSARASRSGGYSVTSGDRERRAVSDDVDAEASERREAALRSLESVIFTAGAGAAQRLNERLNSSTFAMTGKTVEEVLSGPAGDPAAWLRHFRESIHADSQMPPGVIAMESGAERIARVVRSERHVPGTEAAREDYRSFYESFPYFTRVSERGQPYRCEGCGTLVAVVPESEGTAGEWVPGILEHETLRRHTLRRCEWRRANG